MAKKTHTQTTHAPTSAPAPTPTPQEPQEHLADEKQKVAPYDASTTTTTTTTTTPTTTTTTNDKKTVEDIQIELKQQVTSLYEWFMSMRIITLTLSILTGIYEHTIVQHGIAAVKSVTPQSIQQRVEQFYTTLNDFKINYIERFYDFVTYIIAYIIYTTLTIIAVPSDFYTKVSEYLTGAKDVVNEKVDNAKALAHEKVDNAKNVVNEKIDNAKNVVREQRVIVQEKVEPYYAPIVERITAIFNKINDFCFQVVTIVMNIVSPIDREQSSVEQQKEKTFLRPRFKNESLLDYSTTQLKTANETFVLPVYNQIFKNQPAPQQGVHP